jgi:hypothetical protein
MARSPLLALLLLAGCAASDDGMDEHPYSSCTGACDAPGALPILEAIDLGGVVRCTSAVDTSTTDDAFAEDFLECRLERPSIEGASLSASLLVRNDAGVLREALLREGSETVRLGSLPRSGYPYDVIASIRFGLPGDTASQLDVVVSLVSFTTFRDLELEPLRLGLPMSVWPVRIWPDADVESAWSSDVRAISLVGEVVVPLGGGVSFTGRTRKTASASSVKVEALPDVLTVYLPAPAAGGFEAPLGATVHTRSAGSTMRESRLTGAGYHLLARDGSLVRTAIESLPYLPGYAGYGMAEPVPLDSEPVPVPDDPCSGTCRSDEVCVAGGCIERRLQTQDASSCGTPSSARCDAGEDADCADLHACIAGICTNLVCQRQTYPDCPTPTAPCEDDSDCYPGNVCRSGACAFPECG